MLAFGSRGGRAWCCRLVRLVDGTLEAPAAGGTRPWFSLPDMLLTLEQASIKFTR